MQNSRRTTQPKTRIAFFDIETAPNLGWTWGKYEQNVIDFKNDWYMLSFAFKWKGGKVRTYALPDYPRYNRDKQDDKDLVRDLWKLMNEADLIVAHNGDAFDIKKANARFIYHRLDPPSPYKTFDTLKAVRRVASFTSNKLDDLGRDLHLGRKIPHTGKNLWFDCMRGDLKAWKLMRKYNAQDVELLERLYLRIRDWTKPPKIIKKV